MKFIRSNLSALVLSLAVISAALCGAVINSVTPSLAHADNVRPSIYSVTWDPASTAKDLIASKDVTVSGVTLGDFCLASFSVDVVDMSLTCNITATNVATAVLSNNTGGTIDLASGTLRVLIFKKLPTGG